MKGKSLGRISIRDDFPPKGRKQAISKKNGFLIRICLTFLLYSLPAFLGYSHPSLNPRLFLFVVAYLLYMSPCLSLGLSVRNWVFVMPLHFRAITSTQTTIFCLGHMYICTGPRYSFCSYLPYGARYKPLLKKNGSLWEEFD